MGLTGVAVSVALLLGARPPASLPAARVTDPPTAAAAADPWFSDDKYQHFFMSFAGTVFSYGAARTVMDKDAAGTVALAAGAAAGLGKEASDRKAGRSFSLRDLAWDTLGVLAAWTLIRNTR
jgi:uncharacterized protein YfiM (DUF2279 family)